jgi:PAS domain S-box-containing protein
LALGLAVPASLALGPGVLALPVLAPLALAVLDVAEPTAAHQESRAWFNKRRPRRVAMSEHKISGGMSGPHREKDALHVALSSIGDAVITTDADGRATFLNSVAESLTGWTLEEAAGQPIESVFRIMHKESRQPVESPIVRAFRDGVLANRNLLIAKDGTERPIDDSAVPTHTDKGEVAGVVLVFRDITERRKPERASQKAVAYAADIIATLREPFVVLDRDLRVKTANRSFYDSFHVPVLSRGGGDW